jgi:hypothetical protein
VKHSNRTTILSQQREYDRRRRESKRQVYSPNTPSLGPPPAQLCRTRAPKAPSIPAARTSAYRTQDQIERQGAIDECDDEEIDYWLSLYDLDEETAVDRNENGNDSEDDVEHNEMRQCYRMSLEKLTRNCQIIIASIVLSVNTAHDGRRACHGQSSTFLNFHPLAGTVPDTSHLYQTYLTVASYNSFEPVRKKKFRKSLKGELLTAGWVMITRGAYSQWGDFVLCQRGYQLICSPEKRWEYFEEWLTELGVWYGQR